jgi:hypothetical protein
MDQDRARSLLIAERDEVQGLLKDSEASGQEDRVAEVDSESGDTGDAAQSLTAEGMDDAIAESRPVRPKRRPDPRRAPGGGPRRRAHHRGGPGGRARLSRKYV